MPIKFDLSKYKNPIFLETGTFLNQGIRNAFDAGFNTVISIDIQKKFIDRAKNDLPKETENGSLKLFHGDSAEVLNSILPSIEENITFWLDAHVDGSGGIWPDDVEANMRCRAYDELEIISQHYKKGDIILVDDIRGFRSENGWNANISLDGLKKRILSIDGEFKICFEDGHVNDDVLVAYVS